jgi:outer membrane protein OmpA-like peptidoglycan-associated protein
MRSLMTRRPRPCRILRNGIAASAPRLSASRHGFIVVLLTAITTGLCGTTARAQRSAVTVDRSVLDSLGPLDSTANPGSRIRLHMPVQPAQRQPSASAAPKSAVQASNKPAVATSPPEAAPPPQAAPEPQAALVPIAPPASQPAAKSTTPAPAAPAPPAGNAPAPAPATERILFKPDDANLPDEAKQELDRLAARLSADGRLYVQLVAYAGASPGSDASQARRMSLSRALAARSYLVDHGVEIKQIDVRPLGSKSEPGAAPDRVDLVVTQR